MKKTVIQAISILFISFFCTTAVHTQDSAVNAETKDVSNQVLKSIFNDIYTSKPLYKDLDNFDEKSMYYNEYDIFAIQYNAATGEEGKNSLAFALTILPLRDKNPFATYPNSFEYGFPLLGIKFVGFQNQGLKRQQFDINKSIQSFGKQLWLEQQKFLPLKLSLIPLKSIYKKGEAVGFRVVLKNETGKTIVVKELNSETLFFVYNDRVWGAAESTKQSQQKVKNVVLKPGETLEKEFAGNAFLKPQEFEIFCTYNLTYDGVNPSANLKVKVVE